MIRCMLLVLAALSLAPAAAQAQDDLARETAQVEDLRSIREIKRLQAEWGYRAMAGDWKGMAELGTPYVEMVLPGGNAEGREAVERWLRERMGHGVDGMPAGRLNLRLWISPVITLSAMGDRATGRWRQIALLGENGESAQWLGTTDVIEYHKTREGWRIAFVRPYLNFSGPYETGWRHDAATLEHAPYHYMPDEVGRLLPDREADTARPAEALTEEATLLFELGTAQNRAAAYGYYLDRGMYDDIVDLFAPDAQVDVAGQGVYNGAASIRRFLGRYGAPGLDEGELNDHAQLMPLVNVSDDGQTALVRVVDLGMTGRHGGEGFWSAAINTFLLRASERGHWRIQQLHIRPLMRAGYKEGWAHPLPAAMPIGEGLQPDGPPQPVDLSYPDHPFAMQALPAGVIFPAREPGGKVAVLANALAMAEAFDAAENLAGAYGEYINQLAWGPMASLFAPEGWREMPFIGALAGRDKILEGASIRYGDGGAGPRPQFQAIHMLTQPYVTVRGDGTRAQLRARLLQFNSSSTGPGSWIAGVYEKQLVKQDGVWRIQGMDLDYTWMAGYEEGWTAADPAAADAIRPSPELLARYAIDAPLRGDPGIPFPHISPLGFHYTNPVSGREPERLLPWTDIIPKERD
jgi:hypothetical protein